MSQLRQDLVSGEWVVSAPERMKRPSQFKKKNKKKRAPVKGCPFENFEKSGNGPVLSRVPAKGEWRVAVVPNKYPALSPSDACAVSTHQGIYETIQGVGHHELAIPRGHDLNISRMSPGAARELMRVVQERALKIGKDPCVKYVSVFQNWGAESGASIFHPHIQIMGLPIVPPAVQRSIDGSKKYFAAHKRCAHCVLLEFEHEAKKRIVLETKTAVALAPFASREPFEVRIFPKQHYPYFESTPQAALDGVTDAVRKILAKLERNLGGPDYNLFLHSAPVSSGIEHDHYHWHFELVPKLAAFGGLEWETGLEINVVDPEVAAKTLRA